MPPLTRKGSTEDATPMAMHAFDDSALSGSAIFPAMTVTMTAPRLLVMVMMVMMMVVVVMVMRILAERDEDKNR